MKRSLKKNRNNNRKDPIPGELYVLSWAESYAPLPLGHAYKANYVPLVIQGRVEANREETPESGKLVSSQWYHANMRSGSRAYIERTEQHMIALYADTCYVVYARTIEKSHVFLMDSKFFAVTTYEFNHGDVKLTRASKCNITP